MKSNEANEVNESRWQGIIVDGDSFTLKFSLAILVIFNVTCGIDSWRSPVK